MDTIKVVVGNPHLHGVKEEFICSQVDVSSYSEMEYCAEECVGAYVDMYSRFFDQNAEAINDCWYTIEEVPANV